MKLLGRVWSLLKKWIATAYEGFNDQSKVADAHFLVSVVESTPFGEHFGLLVLVLGLGGRAQERQSCCW